MKHRSMFMKMILSSLLRRRSRMLVALLAVAIGSTIISGMITIYYDIPQQLGKEFRSYGANFMVLPAGDDKILGKDLQKLDQIFASQKVIGEAPYRYETTRINQKPYILAGTHLAEAKKNSPFWFIEGDWATAENSDEVMIGKEVAKALNLGLGDRFRVVGVKYGRQVVASDLGDSTEASLTKDSAEDYYDHHFTVKGIITTGGAEEGFIFLELDKLNELLEDETRVDGVECSIEANAQELETLGAHIAEVAPRMAGRPVRRVTQSQDIVLGKLQVLVLLVNLVVLLLTMITVLTTMIAVVTERRKEIGLKKALGAPDESIIKEFLGEGVGLGVLGGILGSILGFFFAQQVSLNVFGRAISFTWWTAPVTLVISILITVVASIWPVKQATKIDPALVLRGE